MEHKKTCFKPPNQIQKLLLLAFQIELLTFLDLLKSPGNIRQISPIYDGLVIVEGPRVKYPPPNGLNIPPQPKREGGETPPPQ